MKFSTFSCGIAALASTNFAFARLSYEVAEAVCGGLGVMNTTALPASINVEDARICADHPLGSPELPQQLDKRKCWYGQPVGCNRHGYCYKSCGPPGTGMWCWTAQRDGFGPWERCSKGSDCSGTMGCGAGGCKGCGCGC
ncbi:hypothetical protein ISF_09421 [Cordyceps fumosorosea ARSEF 2679]|uniref:IDI-2 n=1 Tax=Cordyceps fumosorosea (strain ARSEF 2679) TaxID=1081104 RepID=A0A162JVI5_CORFA|nr:hypothetical protein ISF_09421 [Cordyceps fumosorosea ARSEF 2679]OAA49718.1 hypothetical protein ISF_09421 [Cordyceps fumosorosea ARSEF 2679]